MHTYPQDWKYAIVNSTDLANIDFEECYPKEAKALRYNLANTEFVIKYDENHEPNFIRNGNVVPVSILTWEDCVTLMNTPEWSAPEPVIE